MSFRQHLMQVAEPFIKPLNSLILSKQYKLQKEITPITENNNILVLAPHMDDETIGVGGTMRAHSNRGTELHCVLVTDGSNSISDMDKEALTQARKAEMENVKEVIGINHLYYLDLKDGEVKIDPQSVERLQDIIVTTNPEIIYCPPIVDAHPDHTATTGLLVEALTQLKGSYTIRQYEVNCPLLPQSINAIVDITNTFDNKLQAIKKFTSQVIAFEGFIELNKIKANLVNDDKVKYVETFIEDDSSNLIRNYKLLSDDFRKFPVLFKQVNRSVTLLWAFHKNFKEKKKLYEKMNKGEY